MQSAVINIKVEPKTKKEAQKIADQLGLSLSAVIHGYLKQFIRTQSVEFTLEEIPNKATQKALKEAEEDIKNGFVSATFNNTKDALSWLKDPKAKYANQLRKKV
jgi:addiction module RelB/DinJ family antitoxin